MTEINSRQRKYSFFLGLLCLLPGIGFFVGVTLIALGLFYFRDKKLIYIGSIGVIVTIILFGVMIYSSKFGKESARQFAVITQRDLNGLVRRIELYKIEHGRYPVSLDELYAKDSTVMILDPMLVKKLERKIDLEYHYKTLGDKYALYSVGMDGEANTPDDIYPIVKNTERLKFGLIRAADLSILDANYKPVKYDTAIVSITRNSLDIEWWDALFTSKQFLSLYEHSSWYIVDASNFLSNDTFTEREKVICLNSLQGLSIDKYIPILRHCDSLFNAGKIPESLLSWSVAPNFSNRYLVVRNYTNEEVKEILNSLLQNIRCTPDFKDLIKRILSGELWDNIKDSGEMIND